MSVSLGHTKIRRKQSMIYKVGLREVSRNRTAGWVESGK